jgi:hypothetical protein
MEEIRQNLGNDMNDHKLTKRIIKHFNINLNEYRVSLTPTKIKEGLIFAKGFMRCIEYVGEEPIRKDELDNVIFTEIVDYIVKSIEDDRNK